MKNNKLINDYLLICNKSKEQLINIPIQQYSKIFINKIRKLIHFYFFNFNIDHYNLNHFISFQNIFQKNNILFNKIIFQLKKNNLIIDNYINPSDVKILSQDLTIKPFWNNEIQSLSEKLFLPTSNNLMKSNYKNKTLDSKSWFEINKITGFDNYYYRLKTKDNDNSIKKITKTRKIKLYFNSEQKKYMKQIIGTYRYFYNRTVSFINNFDKKTNISSYLINPNNEKTKIIIDLKDGNIYSAISLRHFIKINYPDWMLANYPSHLIDEAIREASTKFNTCLSTYKKYKKNFNFKFKSKKQLIHTINLEKCMIKGEKNSIFNNWIINNKYLFRNLKTSEQLKKYDILGSSISYHTILKEYHMNVVYNDTTKINNNQNICAIDPGIRKFAVIYSHNKIIEIGKNCNKKLFKVCKEIDIIKSRIDKKEFYEKDFRIFGGKRILINNSRRRKSLRKVLHRKIKYIKNLKTELHNKTIKYLCGNYKKVIYPPFENQKMVGNLSSKTARSLYNLSERLRLLAMLDLDGKHPNLFIYLFMILLDFSLLSDNHNG